jgi:Coenzyme PQQ synthesis protein D (PqqD)
MEMAAVVFRHGDSLVARDLAGEKVIIPVRGKVGDLGSIYTLNAVANDVWNLLDGRRRLCDVVNRLQQEYEVDPRTLASDIQQLMKDLQQEGLIVAEGASE